MESQKFLAFWGLKYLPGEGPIDLDNLYWQERTQTLSARLLISLQKPGSISVIKALPGHGKSTLARWLYRGIDSQSHEVALFVLMKRESAAGWLLPRLGGYLGLPDGADTRAILSGLSLVHDKILTVVIDNAHLLGESAAFDELLSLCQVQSLVDCKINFVLIGNPLLNQTIQAIPDIRHRLTLIGELLPFSRSDLQNYLAQLVQDIGISRRVISPEALALFAQEAPMTFAGVNRILETSLYEAFLKDQKVISAEIVLGALEATGTRPVGETQSAARSVKLAPKQKASSGGPSGTGDLNALFYKSGAESDEDE